MKVHLRVKQLFCKIPTDNNFLNDRDEAYFVVGGGSVHGKINIPRVSPPPPEDYYGLHAGEHADNIELWSGDLNDGESARLIVLLREQDNAQLGAIVDGIKGAIEAVAGFFTDNAELTQQGLQDLAKAGGELVESLSQDGDQTIGGFTAAIQVDAGCVMVTYGALGATTLSSTNDTAANFHATGSDADYTMSVEVPTAEAMYIGVYRPGTDGYALWNSDWTSFLNYHEKASAQGLRLSSLTTYVEHNARFFLGVYRAGTDQHQLVYDLDFNAFVAKSTDLFNHGLRLVNITTYLTNGRRLFAGAFRAGSDAQWITGGADWDTFNKEWADLSSKNRRLVNIITWKEKGHRRFVGVFRAGTDGHSLWVGVDWNGFVAKWKELSGKGLRLIDLTTFHDNGQQLYAAVFRAGTDGYGLYGASWKNFTANWQSASTHGLRLLDVAAYAPSV